jgi:hypothetical protein
VERVVDVSDGSQQSEEPVKEETSKPEEVVPAEVVEEKKVEEDQPGAEPVVEETPA